MKRLIVRISGASGVIYGIRMLEMLRAVGGVETLPADPRAHRTPGTVDHEIRGQLSDTPPGESYRQYETLGFHEREVKANTGCLLTSQKGSLVIKIY
jgi:3-polyprenyl-4-hydroxybenzoate decarboxylase